MCIEDDCIESTWVFTVDCWMCMLVHALFSFYCQVLPFDMILLWFVSARTSFDFTSNCDTLQVKWRHHFAWSCLQLTSPETLKWSHAHKTVGFTTNKRRINCTTAWTITFMWEKIKMKCGWLACQIGNIFLVFCMNVRTSRVGQAGVEGMRS